MTIVSWQWPLVLSIPLIRVLAPGWYLFLTVLTLGLPLWIACAPLLITASIVTPDQHHYLQLADLCLLIAAFTLPDGGDNAGHHIPVVTLVKFDPELDVESPIAKALITIGLLAVLGYIVSLAAIWISVNGVW
ncbi:hypothetical protein ACFXHA_06945 [Nocardia sp. NPDC059240]|uniref:hypothetical protein n=1 Tax=Nocardia sp. NPDC059240 TaxID=3346786 RepID=UPI0036C4E521